MRHTQAGGNILRSTRRPARSAVAAGGLALALLSAGCSAAAPSPDSKPGATAGTTTSTPEGHAQNCIQLKQVMRASILLTSARAAEMSADSAKPLPADVVDALTMHHTLTVAGIEARFSPADTPGTRDYDEEKAAVQHIAETLGARYGTFAMPATNIGQGTVELDAMQATSVPCPVGLPSPSVAQQA